ncbi:MAG TPA: hypothetical protein VEJ00_11655, partial [Candidatus Acidoferrales bacterium]|nr:hypothetical protein [Candidatus Acidoferrales bacterium]
RHVHCSKAIIHCPVILSEVAVREANGNAVEESLPRALAEGRFTVLRYCNRLLGLRGRAAL